jgi:hypothetical protein
MIVNTITKKNSHGELIEIKLEKSKIMIRHSDVDDKFKSLDSFFRKIILSDDEVIMIYKACQELNLSKEVPELSSTFKKIFH